MIASKDDGRKELESQQRLLSMGQCPKAVQGWHPPAASCPGWSRGCPCSPRTRRGALGQSQHKGNCTPHLLSGAEASPEHCGYVAEGCVAAGSTVTGHLSALSLPLPSRTNQDDVSVYGKNISKYF